VGVRKKEIEGMAGGLTSKIECYASDHGIDVIGITSAEPFVRNGEVIDPRELLADARSVVVAGFFMKEEDRVLSVPPDRPTGRFSSAYNVRAFTAMEAHYFNTLRRFLEKEGFKAVLNDKYRIPDKPAAVRAGLGRYGKNSVILTEKYGSCVMFVTIVTDAPLNPAASPMEGDACGGCDLCLRSCPTNAFPAPYKINRKLCITNWLWGIFVPAALREKQDDRLFGCGDCVRVCQKNRKLEPRRKYPVPLENVEDRPELIPLAAADAGYYKKVFAAFPLRAGVNALRGNVINALGNTANDSAVEPLGRTLHHSKPQIRAYSAWALGRIGGTEARRHLRHAKSSETERSVLEDIDFALRPSAARR
jgi:epoxyqueuosine reductase